MRLDGERLRARRLQLGQTIRGLARESRASQTLIKRLEETGQIETLTCATLQRILAALSVDLVDVLEKTVAKDAATDERTLERLGAILLGTKSGVTTVALSSMLAIDATTVEAQLACLAARLQPLGIRVHHGSTGNRLVQSELADLPGVASSKRLEAPTITDLRILHRAVSGTLHVREVATMKNGNISLHRLSNSRLVDITPDGTIAPGPTAQDALIVAAT